MTTRAILGMDFLSKKIDAEIPGIFSEGKHSSIYGPPRDVNSENSIVSPN
jgi:hypothetical protein